MENILFKLSFPAEFHAQTACEAAVTLHPQVKDKLDQIERIEITTHESAIRIISKQGELANPADRDHCLQYMTAVPLIFGELTADHYEDEFHQANPLIDTLREKMVVSEDKRYSEEYHQPDKRSIANAVQVFFNDGSATDKVEVEYPIGHRRRREEGFKVLEQKFENNLRTRFARQRVEQIMRLYRDPHKLVNTPVNQFMDLLVT
jgi:2-methylcitrate dehydratase